MNSTQKGQSFEEKVHGIIQKLLLENQFSISGNFYEIFRQKEYYSSDRQGNIKIDISIEFRRSEGSKPSLYIFIECKDYSKPIPVDDIEEFYAKTQQISGINAKAMLFTKSSLQQGAFNYAFSKGIAVVRLLDKEALSWLIERTTDHVTTNHSNSVAINVINALTNENIVTTRRNTFALYKDKSDYEILSILEYLITQ